MENSVLSPVAVQTINLTRHFGDKVAVDQLNLAVAEGEFFGFLGPNGRKVYDDQHARGPAAAHGRPR